MPGRYRLAVSAICGLLARGRKSSPPVPTADEMHEIERETYLTFPPSTRVLMWDAGRGIDAYLEMKFEIAASDWPGFLASSPFRDHPLQEGAWADLPPDHGAWDPSMVAQGGYPPEYMAASPIRRKPRPEQRCVRAPCSPS
jgi:hypothetical protein